MVAVMGSSASGKFTLLYAVSGMDVPTSGTVLFEEKDITKLTANELAQIKKVNETRGEKMHRAEV